MDKELKTWKKKGKVRRNKLYVDKLTSEQVKKLVIGSQAKIIDK
ncbi:MAG TPA: hypothetical protein PLL26_04475 [Candidatus Dojkabacteria bacterium]|nr:hypothetical protein [Candidatus Dojkabacteria bacterium]